MVIHKKMYNHLHYFQNKQKSFIAWIERLIKPMHIEDSEYLYKEGEEIHESKI